MDIKITPSKLIGTVNIPSSKSIAPHWLMVSPKFQILLFQRIFMQPLMH